jgi:glycosyltransferase involved in cell wall biosynthesis
VESALAQRFDDLEVLVSDNASEDGTREAMEAYRADPRFRYVRNQTNLGMVGNWRKAVFEAARGEFFLILSDDDTLLRTDYLAKAMALVDGHQDVVMVYANGYVLHEGRGEREELRLPFGTLETGTTVFASRGRIGPQDFTLCNVLFRRALAIELDAFSNPLNICCDSELFLESCLFGNVGIVHDFVSQYRMHGDNLITRHHQDPRIYAASLDYFFKPRRLALARKALTWKQRWDFGVVTRRAMKQSLFVVAERNPDYLGDFVRQLWRHEPGLTLGVLTRPRLLATLVRHAVRRRLGGGR